LLPDWGYLTTEIQFRVIMGLGAIPAAIVFWYSIGYKESIEFKKSHSESPLREAFRHRAYWGLLMGTAGTWFLYDIAFYGINIFTPDIIKSIFGDQSNVATCWQSLVAQSIGIPGCVLAIVALDRKGIYWLMLYGFWLLVALFAFFAAVYNFSPDGCVILKFVIYCLLTFALNFGPNVATYVLPTACFPPELRSLFHGLSAASAKMGAVVGSFAFQPIKDAWGIAVLMWIQAGLCVLGALVTIRFVKKDRGGVSGESRPLLTN
jgi:PHS family inorganic phosphate transporter-like MFS transporter